MEPEVLSPASFSLAVAHTARQFWARTLPYPAWNHVAHLAVALDAVARGRHGEALVRLRAGIRAYNEAHGVSNSLTSGYHETLTMFFVGAVADFYQGHCGASLEAIYPSLLAKWGDKNTIFAFYSRRQLFSPYARMEWRPPDLQPLPFEVEVSLVPTEPQARS